VVQLQPQNVAHVMANHVKAAHFLFLSPSPSLTAAALGIRKEREQERERELGIICSRQFHLMVPHFQLHL